MLSWQIVEHGKPLQKVMKETPRPQGAEVLMRITRSGVEERTFCSGLPCSTI